MTDTPIIALYYREHDPMKRKMFLDQSIAAGEDEEANAVRKELWELRYGEPSEAGSGTRADGYLALWMAMEYSKDTAGKLFGLKRARKEIEKNLARQSTSSSTIPIYNSFSASLILPSSASFIIVAKSRSASV